MKASVFIPKTNTKVFQNNSNGGTTSWQIKKEVQTWLKKYTPTYFLDLSVYRDMGPGHFYGEEDYLGERWCFDTKEQAMFFKLTWAD